MDGQENREPLSRASVSVESNQTEPLKFTNEVTLMNTRTKAGRTSLARALTSLTRIPSQRDGVEG